jgi:hypothetical protein
MKNSFHDFSLLFFGRGDGLSSFTLNIGTGTPKDKDEVNKREVCECDG